jgi:hypothetical protein
MRRKSPQVAGDEVARITHLNGLTVCQTNDGTVVVPIQWDYVVGVDPTVVSPAAISQQKHPF